MTIDLAKCAYPAKNNEVMTIENVHKKYLLGTYSQEEAIQLVNKLFKVNIGQTKNAVE